MQKRFNEIAKTQLYYVEVDRDKIWQIYLDAFSPDKKQENTCNCCKSFLRQYGGVVGIKDNQMVTLWDFETEDDEYKASIKALNKYIRSLPIAGLFFNPFKKCGVEKNPDTKRSIIWEHFYLELPAPFIKKETEIGPKKSESEADKGVFQRSLNELTDDAVDTVLELIAQGSLYRGEEHKEAVSEFRKIKERYKKIKNKNEKENFCWAESVKTGKFKGVVRIKNTSIGTLLENLSGGMELDKAVSAYEKVVAPSNYKRPKSLITPKQIEAAQKTLEELGLTGALYRRHLSNKDLTVNNALFVYRPKAKAANIFEELKQDVVINPKTLSKIEEISISDFVEKVLPTAKSIRALVENQHLGNFVSLIGPQDADSGRLFKWNNDCSWDYSGQVADSMRAKVVELGGRVDGVLRFTHSWNHPEVGRNASLMDLHVFMPGSYSHKDGCHDGYPSGQRVGWNNRNDYESGGTQDVDYTNAAPEGHVPIENITFPSMKRLKDGKYTFKIHNWSFRNPTTSGFKAEIEFAGQVYHYNHPAPLKQKEWVTLAEVTLKNGVFTIEHKMESKPTSQTKWNIGTEKFHNVSSVCLSPNYWGEKGTGNKHFFFMLEGCENTEAVRGFYNEMLRADLDKDRKVFEILAGKVKVEKAENELSGIGFSETVRADLILEVESKFKRLIRVKF